MNNTDMTTLTEQQSANEISDVLTKIRNLQVNKIEKAEDYIDVTGFGVMGGGPDRKEINFCEVQFTFFEVIKEDKKFFYIEDYKITYGQYTNGRKIFANDYPDLSEQANREIVKESIINYLNVDNDLRGDNAGVSILFEDEQ
jgi:selenophosphate synthase